MLNPNPKPRKPKNNKGKTMLCELCSILTPEKKQKNKDLETMLNRKARKPKNKTALLFAFWIEHSFQIIVFFLVFWL